MTTPTRRGLPDLGELEIEHGRRAISHDLFCLGPAHRSREGPQRCGDWCPGVGCGDACPI
jgi:hypothetical protein